MAPKPRIEAMLMIEPPKPLAAMRRAISCPTREEAPVTSAALPASDRSFSAVTRLRSLHSRHLAQEVALAELYAIVAQNGVGRGSVEVEIGHREMHQIGLALERDGVAANFH